MGPWLKIEIVFAFIIFLVVAYAGNSLASSQEILYVDSLDSTYLDWTASGVSPYIDDSASYLYTKQNGATEGNFGFLNSAVSAGTINSVTLSIEASSDDAPNGDGFNLYVSDGTGFISLGILQPSSTAYTWENVSLTSLLNTWNKINSATAYFLYSKSGGPGYVYMRRAYLYIDYEPADVTSPTVNLVAPLDYENFTINEINFNCSMSDSGNGLFNSTLFGNWLGVWEANETVSVTGANNSSFFSKTIPDGIYLWNCYSCDVSGNCDFAPFNRTFTIDSTPPSIGISFPQNITYLTDVNELNCSIQDLNGLDSCWYTLDGGSTNITMTCGDNVTEINSFEGSNTWAVYANDSFGNQNFSSVTFYKHTTNPSATITFPLNLSYFADVTELNYTYFGADCESVWYSVDGGLTNSTSQPCGLNWSGLSSFEGSNVWIVYINDSYSGENFTAVAFTKDTLPPTVNLAAPVDYGNFTINEINFNCSMSDSGSGLINSTLFGNWSGTWSANETLSITGGNNFSLFTEIIPDGTYLWNCYSCDVSGNCGFATQNRSFTIDTIPPEVTLIYPGDNQTFAFPDIAQFNFSVNDNASIDNCTLYGDFNSSWAANQTINFPVKEVEINFSGLSVLKNSLYRWNVECSDSFGNKGMAADNFTFSSFDSPSEPILNSITQEFNDGSGSVTLFWNASNYSVSYKIYSGSNASNLTFLDETTELNYTDNTFAGNRRMFYKIVATNPTGENSSSGYFGTHVYSLHHNGLTRNLVSFPTDFGLSDANDTLHEITNATSVTMYNATMQRKVTCNGFSCPDSFSCTDTNCNFEINPGLGYEVGENSSAPNEVNWSGTGIVNEPLDIDLIKNITSSGKNWISMTAFTNLTNAQELLSSFSNADAVTRWNSETQKSEGLIYVFGMYLGINFNITPEEGYEVSVTSDETWRQS